MEMLKDKVNELQKDLEEIPILQKFEAKTGVKASHFVLGLLGVIALILFIGSMGQLLTDIVGFLYPAYKSLKSLESAKTSDDKQWLTYWAVLGIFVIVDTYSAFILSYMPSYYLIKFLFVIWLMSPMTRGAQVLYDKVLRNLFLKNQEKLQNLFNTAEDTVGEAAQEAFKKGKEMATDPSNIAKASELVNDASKLLSPDASKADDKKDE